MYIPYFGYENIPKYSYSLSLTYGYLIGPMKITPNFENRLANFLVTKICYIPLESWESLDSKNVIFKIIEWTF